MVSGTGRTVGLYRVWASERACVGETGSGASLAPGSGPPYRYADRPATTVVPVTGPQYDPVEMDYQMPYLGRTGPPTAWLTTARTSRRMPPRGASTADPPRRLRSRRRRTALTSMRSAPFGRPEQGRAAVKVVTATGMEMTAVQQIGAGCES